MASYAHETTVPARRGPGTLIRTSEIDPDRTALLAAIRACSETREERHAVQTPFADRTAAPWLELRRTVRNYANAVRRAGWTDDQLATDLRRLHRESAATARRALRDTVALWVLEVVHENG